jgi:acyl-CoA synthetase (AMP-forming)/AMP-acid ligase II
MAYAVSLELTSEDRVLACMPGYVYRGGSGGFAPAVAGAHTVVAEFDADRVLELVERHRITQVTLAPAMATRVLDRASASPVTGRDLRRIWLTGAPAAASTITTLAERFDAVVGCLYGMTEATGIAMITHRPDQPGLITSIGRPMVLLDVRLLDEDGREVAPGEVGEIVVRGDTVTPGYWNDPDLTAEALRDGWLHTGDLATRDANGNLFIVDRRADIINSGGLNIYTSQVELAILSHPEVVDCTVIGAPDDTWGEIPVAVVVAGGELSEAEVIEWAGRTVASFKKPRLVRFVTELPRNAMGKVDKRAVRDPYWAACSRKVGA